jgi:alpha-soluble NSF attachment protein
MQKNSESFCLDTSTVFCTAVGKANCRKDREAGQAFEKAANVQLNSLKDPDDAANTYVDAYKVYRQENPEDAARCLDFSINQYCTKGNFRRAASHKENLGDLFENQLGDMKRALEAYEAAAGWYEGDGAAAYVLDLLTGALQGQVD